MNCLPSSDPQQLYQQLVHPPTKLHQLIALDPHSPTLLTFSEPTSRSNSQQQQLHLETRNDSGSSSGDECLNSKRCSSSLCECNRRNVLNDISASLYEYDVPFANTRALSAGELAVFSIPLCTPCVDKTELLESLLLAGHMLR